MNIALIFYGNPPEQGGVGQVLDCLTKSFKDKDDNLYFFNPFYKCNNTINIREIRRYHIFQLIPKFLKKTTLRFLLTSFWKVIRDTKISRTDRLKILLYLLVKPNTLANAQFNIEYMYPFINQMKIDIFLGGTATADVLVLIYFLSRIFNKKVASLTYGNEFLVHSRYSLRTVFFKNLDLLILGAYSIKELIKKVHHLEEEKLAVIRYGLIPRELVIKESKKELREEFDIPKDQFVLISVGRHVSRKNFDLVIKAVSIIKEKKPSMQTTYFLIGEGEETLRLKKLVKDLDLTNEVKFLGHTNIKTRNKYYKLSDVFLMPSVVESESIEGFGIVFLEANYFNLPVIGTYSGGIVEAIEDGKTGLLVNQNDLNDLTEKILFLYENKDKRELMGQQGHERVIEDFNWDKLVNEYLNIFQSLLNISRK